MENIRELKNSKIVTDILNQAFMTVAIQFNFTKENAPRFPAFIDLNVIENSMNNGLKMFGYELNKQIVACVGYSHYKDQIYFIERLATLPEYRHLGIGKKLMKFAENKIRENNGKIIEIHVVDVNKTLIDWYKKLDFIGIRIDEIKAVPFNSYVMNKNLD